MFLIKQLIEKAVADNAMFLHSYNEVQARIFPRAVVTRLPASVGMAIAKSAHGRDMDSNELFVKSVTA
jgi:hypothetical protein